MIIKEIKITAFGKWENKSLQLDEHFTKIIGNNESGKTTIREFIKAILYGYANNKMKIASYKPKTGKKIAGSLVVEIDGTDFEIYRDEKDLQITNLKTDEKILNPQQFLDDYLGSINRETFENSFEFSIQQLAKIQSLKANELETSILNVGIPNAKDLKDLQENYTKEAGDLYKAKGSIPTINKKLVEYEELLAEKQRQKDLRADYQSLLAEKEAIEDNIKTVSEDLAKQQEELLKQVLINEKKSLFETYNKLKESFEKDSVKLKAKVTDSQFLEIKNLDNQEKQIEKELESLQQVKQVENTEHLFDDLIEVKKEKAIYDETEQLIQLKEKELDSTYDKLLTFPKVVYAIVAYDQIKTVEKQLDKWKRVFALGIFNVLLAFCFLPFNKMVAGAVLAFAVGLIVWNLLFKELVVDIDDQSITALFAYRHRSEFYECLKVQDESWEISQELTALKNKLEDLTKLSSVKQKYFNDQRVLDYDLAIYKLDLLIKNAEQNVNEELLNNKKVQLSLIKEQKQRLLEESSANDLDELEANLLDSKELDKKAERISILKQQLGDDFEQLSAQQTTNAKELKQEIDQKEAFLDSLRNTVAEKNNKLSYYSSSKEYAALNQKIENFKNELVLDFNDYFTKMLSAKLIESYMSLQSEDRYPKMLSLANEYFNRLTENKYQGIDINKNKITIIDHDKKKFELKELSTATSEQLYISFKLAFAKVVGQAINMPMIIDDGFVNFDANRKEIMLAILKDVSLTNQVIFFALNDEIKINGKTIQLERN